MRGLFTLFQIVCITLLSIFYGIVMSFLLTIISKYLGDLSIVACSIINFSFIALFGAVGNSFSKGSEDVGLTVLVLLYLNIGILFGYVLGVFSKLILNDYFLIIIEKYMGFIDYFYIDRKYLSICLFLNFILSLLFLFFSLEDNNNFVGKSDVIYPNQRIFQPIIDSILYGLLILILSWLIIFKLYNMYLAFSIAPVLGITAAIYWNSSSLKHYILRIIISSEARIPLKLIDFLDFAVQRIFLRKVGASYIFIHQSLQNYFSKLD